MDNLNQALACMENVQRIPKDGLKAKVRVLPTAVVVNDPPKP
jgi:hypothetical protein